MAGFDMGNLGALMGNVQKMMGDMQARAAEIKATGTAGNGAVTVVLSGDYHCESIEVKPEALGDREMLEDLLKAATNEALRQVKAELAKEASKFTGGLPLPPGMFPGL